MSYSDGVCECCGEEKPMRKGSDICTDCEAADAEQTRLVEVFEEGECEG
jgi:hypothetical protein